MARGSGDGLALDVERDREARAADLRQQRAEAVEAGLGRELELVAVASHRAKQPAHLGERRATRPLDAASASGLVGELVGQLVAHGADLEHHHAHGVGDDVVELARDPRALLRDGDPRRGLALPLRLRRARLGGLGLLGALAQREAREPGDPEQERDEDELAGRVAGLLSTTIVAMPPMTTASPTRAWTASRRLPSRNAASIPAR